jgi:ActR/RegA family two-component response regulator
MMVKEMKLGTARDVQEKLRAAASVLTGIADYLGKPTDHDTVEMLLSNIRGSQEVNIDPAVRLLTEALEDARG